MTNIYQVKLIGEYFQGKDVNSHKPIVVKASGSFREDRKLLEEISKIKKPVVFVVGAGEQINEHLSRLKIPYSFDENGHRITNKEARDAITELLRKINYKLLHELNEMSNYRFKLIQMPAYGEKRDVNDYTGNLTGIADEIDYKNSIIGFLGVNEDKECLDFDADDIAYHIAKLYESDLIFITKPGNQKGKSNKKKYKKELGERAKILTPDEFYKLIKVN